jgi:DNA recombination protein RmuC
MDIIFLIIGLLIGGITSFLIAKYKFSSEKGVSPEEINRLNTEVSNLKTSLGKTEERILILQKDNEEKKSELISERNKSFQLASELSAKNTSYDNLKTRLEEQKTELETLQQKFTKDFELIANKILENKTEKFTEQNKTNLEQVLKPLNEKIKDFEASIARASINETELKSKLIQQIESLKDLNYKITTETSNLTNALKGDKKFQGSWGEVVLERILEMSGLTKGVEYDTQEKYKTDDGDKQPDVIINLPESKYLVIDSKVSLVAYEKYFNCTDEAERGECLKRHIDAIETHIKTLSKKDYHLLHNENSPDFVLLFIPIEGALILAVQNDRELYNKATKSNIIIVSPSLLLAMLKTISTVWVREKQKKNVLEIAKQSGELYNKFADFVKDLERVRSNMGTMNKSFDDAFNKLSEGRGNIINRIEKIKKLGANATKSLPEDLIQLAEENENQITEQENNNNDNERPSSSIHEIQSLGE